VDAARDGGPLPNLPSWNITPDRTETDLAGLSVAVQGDLALVGARDPAWAGEVWIARRGAGLAWSFTGELLDVGGAFRAPDARFGASVAISGDWVLVGAPGDSLGTRPGEAHFFRRVGGAFEHRSRVQAPEPRNGDWFGVRVALDGDLAVVGAPGREVDPGSPPGAVHVFRRSGDGDFAPGETLHAPAVQGGSSGTDLFGVELRLVRGTLVVAAPLRDDTGPDVGAVFVAEERGGVFQIQHTLTPGASDPPAYRFGDAAMGLGEGVLLVPASGSELHAFARSAAGVWAEETFPRPSGYEPETGFGWRAAISGDRAVVCVRGGKGGRGSALLYRRTKAGFQFEREFWPPSAASELFGWAVAFEGSTAAITALQFRNHDGTAYFFPLP
jgi:hypothetical protein